MMTKLNLGLLLAVLSSGDQAPAGLSATEKAAFESLHTFFTKNAGYGVMMVTRPQTVGFGLSHSPVGLAAWIYDKFAQWTYSGGEPERSLTKDEMLDDITLYWLTNSAISSARFSQGTRAQRTRWTRPSPLSSSFVWRRVQRLVRYWENNNNNFSAAASRSFSQPS